MSTTIRHTHSLGGFASALVLLSFRPVRWLIYLAIVAGVATWIWDSSTEFKLKPNQYEIDVQRDMTVESSKDTVFQNVHFANRSPYTVQSIYILFRLYDCPSETAAIENCSKIRVDKQTFSKEIAAGEGADFDYNTVVGGSLKGDVRVVPVVKEVLADEDASGDGFVG